jgi:hypothetical protein
MYSDYKQEIIKNKGLHVPPLEEEQGTLGLLAAANKSMAAGVV